MPMTALFEAYLDGDVDVPDMDAFLDARQDIVNYALTKHHFEFLFTRFIPEVAIHSKAQDERIVREHYDRGDDFFAAFLGERMVYTSAFFRDEKESLEAAQDNKLDLVCRKLMVAPGNEMLDMGAAGARWRCTRRKTSGRERPVSRSARTRRRSETLVSRRLGSPSGRASSASTTARSRAASTTASRAWRWSSTWA
jgi:hypothetical protein